MFQVINVGEFFNINIIETFELILKSLIFFLVFWLDVLDTLQSLLGSFEFLLSSLEFVLQFSLVESKLFYRFFHVFHFGTLTVDDILNCSFDVNLLLIAIKVSGNWIKELGGFLSSISQLFFLTEEIIKLCAWLSDLSCKLTCCFEVM